MLDTGGDISDGGDLGELGVWKSTGDIRAGVVMADTYLCEHRIPPRECSGNKKRKAGRGGGQSSSWDIVREQSSSNT